MVSLILMVKEGQQSMREVAPSGEGNISSRGRAYAGRFCGIPYPGFVLHRRRKFVANYHVEKTIRASLICSFSLSAVSPTPRSMPKHLGGMLNYITMIGPHNEAGNSSFGYYGRRNWASSVSSLTNHWGPEILLHPS